MLKSDKLGKHRILPFTKSRRNIVLIVHEGFRKHSVHAIIEVDVTNGRETINKIRREKGNDISFTGWLVKCVGEAVSKHKELNTYRLGKRKAVIFEDVDIPIPIERRTQNETRPMAYIVRKANEKSVYDITKEIRRVQEEKVEETTQVLGDFRTAGERFIINSPMFIKKLAVLILRGNGIFKKKHFGTVAVTSIGMKGNFPGWAIPMGAITTTIIAIGGITKKPGVVGNNIAIREYLPITITVDHDLVDGGPLARFVDTLKNLIESARFLDE
jgi:pyruvate/2-oxoglutarate dehydrogenase complex dihydrolipoamide acyltransferase (E2) component